MRLPETRIVLRDERRDADDEDLFRWLNLEEWNYYDEPDRPFRGMSRGEFERQVEQRRCWSREPSSNSHRWQIDTAEGRHIGWVNYYHLDEQAKRAYVGICLPEEDVWGKGYGTEAVRLLVDHLFHKIELVSKNSHLDGQQAHDALCREVWFPGNGPDAAPGRILCSRGTPGTDRIFYLSWGVVS